MAADDDPFELLIPILVEPGEAEVFLQQIGLARWADRARRFDETDLGAIVVNPDSPYDATLPYGKAVFGILVDHSTGGKRPRFLKNDGRTGMADLTFLDGHSFEFPFAVAVWALALRAAGLPDATARAARYLLTGALANERVAELEPKAEAMSRLRRHREGLAVFGALRPVEAGADRSALGRELAAILGPEVRVRFWDDFAEAFREIFGLGLDEARARIDAASPGKRQPAGHRTRLPRVIGQSRADEIPPYFTGRADETAALVRFVLHPYYKAMVVAGRPGTGKTVLVCRLLESLARGELPDGGDPVEVNAVVYPAPTSGGGGAAFAVRFARLYADLVSLLPDEAARPLTVLAADPKIGAAAKTRELLRHFPRHPPTFVLIENFEELLDPQTLESTDAELDEALRALATTGDHGIKVIITSQFEPAFVRAAELARVDKLPLRGLSPDDARRLLRWHGAHGARDLQDASDAVLDDVATRADGNPDVLNALVRPLKMDDTLSLGELLPPVAQVLPEVALQRLSGKTFERLDPLAQRVAQAIAIHSTPLVPGASPEAVDDLLAPYPPPIDVRAALRRLVHAQFVRRNAAGLYGMTAADRHYARAQVPVREPAAGPGTAVGPPAFTRPVLLARAADYIRRQRGGRAVAPPATYADALPDLAEFELRFDAGQFDEASDVLKDIDFEGLMPCGQHALVRELRERLRPHLRDPGKRGYNAAILGICCEKLGYLREGVAYNEEALGIARQAGRVALETVAAANLANCYQALGRTAEAITLHRKALEQSEAADEVTNQGVDLTNLGCCYASAGQTGLALEHHRRALTTGCDNPTAEANRLCNVAECLIDNGDLRGAIDLAGRAAAAAERSNDPSLNITVWQTFALAYLLDGNLPQARATAGEAMRWDSPLLLALLGTIALRQGDTSAAGDALAAAVDRADRLLSRTPGWFRPLDLKGHALAGLALLDKGRPLSKSMAAFHAARQANRDEGVVARVLRLLDALAPAGAADELVPVRRAAGSPS